MSAGQILTIEVDYDKVTIKQPGVDTATIKRCDSIGVLEWHALWDSFKACLEEGDVAEIRDNSYERGCEDGNEEGYREGYDAGIEEGRKLEREAIATGRQTE
jgi:hypothetical protein